MKNNKGFTLIELIIAISIFSTLIVIGYRIFNKSNILIKSQQEITNNQISLNLINTYLNKDLVESISISDIIWLNDNIYEYEIKKKNNIVKYIIVTYKDINKDYCDIIRNEDDIEIEIVKRQEVEEKTPFTILKDEIKDIYTVKLQYIKNKNLKIIDFNVSSRIDIN